MQERPATHITQKHFFRKHWFIALSTIVLAFALGGALVILPQNFAARAANPPSILIIPKSVSYSQQQSIRVGGSYFGANQGINVYFNYTGPGTGTLEQSLISSPTGQFLAHFSVPLIATGTYTIAAVGQKYNDVGTGTVQILPQLYMSPRAAGPGTLAYFYGNDFGNGEQVNIYWNYTGPGTGSLLTTAPANATGSFQVKATVPSNKLGQIPVVAIGQTSQTSASTAFMLYKSTLALAPVSGPPGTQLTVSAVGYTAFEKVNFYWNNSSTPFASPAANPNGYVAPFTFTVPAGTLPANYVVTGTGVKSLITITNTFTVVAPASIFTITSGPVGSSVKVTGSGYAPGETVNVQWNYTGPGTGTTVATATANVNNGVFTTSFTVPTATTGNYPLAVVGVTSSSVTTSSFTIANSLAIGPNTAPPGTNVTATGTGFHAGEMVQLFLDNTSGTLLASTNADTHGNINIPIALPTSTTPGAHTVIGVGLTSALSFSAPLTINTNWGDFGFDTVHSRYNPNEYSLGVSNASSLNLKWSSFTALGMRSSPVYANGIVYIGTHDGMLIAFNATTGAQLWEKNFTLAFEVPSAPLVDPVNNLVFFGTVGFENSGIPSPFYALDATTGQLKWSIVMPWNNFGFPSLHFNTVYIGASREGGSAMLNAIDEMSGHINWQHTTSGGVWGSVAADIVGGVNTIFTGMGNPGNSVLSLNAATGALNWSYPVPLSPGGDDVGSGISVSNGHVYASSKNGNFYALNESDGTLAWSTAIGRADIGNVSSPAVGPDGTIYVGSYDKHLYALDPSGNILWTITTGGLIDGSPAVANGVVYFSSNDGSIYAANANASTSAGGGTVLWSYNTGRLSHASPIVVNGWLYATSSNGNAYGFSL